MVKSCKNCKHRFRSHCRCVRSKCKQQRKIIKVVYAKTGKYGSKSSKTKRCGCEAICNKCRCRTVNGVINLAEPTTVLC